MEEAISFTIPQKWMQKGYTEQKSGKIQNYFWEESGGTGWQSMFARRAVYICQESACMSCGICLEGCPTKAVFYHRNHPIIDSCLCDDCGWCEANCPAGAILRTVQMTPV